MSTRPCSGAPIACRNTAPHPICSPQWTRQGPQGAACTLSAHPSCRSSGADPVHPPPLQEVSQLRGRLEGSESALAQLLGEHQALQEEHQRSRAATSPQREKSPRAVELQEQVARLQQELAVQQDRAVTLQQVCPAAWGWCVARMGAPDLTSSMPLPMLGLGPLLLSRCRVTDVAHSLCERGRYAALFCKGLPALKVLIGCWGAPHRALPCMGIYLTVQEVERQHEALQEAGSAHSQREGQFRGVQAEVSRLQVRWISDVVVIRLLGAKHTLTP